MDEYLRAQTGKREFQTKSAQMADDWVIRYESSQSVAGCAPNTNVETIVKFVRQNDIFRCCRVVDENVEISEKEGGRIVN